MSTAFEEGVAFPARLAGLRDRAWHRVTLGESGAEVWHIEGQGETLFLKAAPQHDLSEMPREADRLRWLSTTSLPAPRLRDSFVADGQDWLLTTAVPGRDLTQFVDGGEAPVLLAPLQDPPGQGRADPGKGVELGSGRPERGAPEQARDLSAGCRHSSPR